MWFDRTLRKIETRMYNWLWTACGTILQQHVIRCGFRLPFQVLPQLHKFALLTLIIFLTMGNYVWADIYEDAKIILDAKKGTVKRWEISPQFVIIYNPKIDIKLVNNTIKNISFRTNLDIKKPIYKEFKLVKNEEDFYTKTNFKIKRNSELKTTGQLEIHGDSISKLRGNIFVFFVDPKYASHFILLTSFGGDRGGFGRGYIQQINACFYSAFSNSQSILLGMVFISPSLEENDLSACIHEEMFQVMGLVNDAPGSKSFNFDDLPLMKLPIFDEYLLKALYAPEVKTGSPVGNVIAIFKSILNSE